jgi:hypothetical protein
VILAGWRRVKGVELEVRMVAQELLLKGDVVAQAKRVDHHR